MMTLVEDTDTIVVMGRTFHREPYRRCPRHLVNRHCRGADRLDIGRWCWCKSCLNDHGARWTPTDGGHGRFVMWEPYQAHGDDLAEVIAAAHADGLTVTIHSHSPWNPGSTIAICFYLGDGPWGTWPKEGGPCPATAAASSAHLRRTP